MKTNKKNILKLSTALFKGSFVHNPALTQVIGICPIVGAATTFTDALALSVMLTINLIVCEAVTSLLLKRTPRWLRMCVYTLISLVLVLLCDSLIFKLTPGGSSGLGIYFYLLCINALIVIRCEKFACKTGVINSIADGFAAGVGYAGAALIVGAVRGYINYGTLFPSSDAVPRLSQTAMPFVALIILGFLAAVHKWILIKFYPEEARDTFSMKAVFEAPVKKDPGLFTDKNKNKPKVIRDFSGEIRPRHSDAEDKKEVEE